MYTDTKYVKKVNLIFIFIFSIFFSSSNVLSACCAKQIVVKHVGASTNHADCHESSDKNSSENCESTDSCHLVCCNLLVTKVYTFTSNMTIDIVKDTENSHTKSLYLSLYLDKDLRPPIFPRFII